MATSDGEQANDHQGQQADEQGGSGADARRLWATLDSVTVTAWNAPELRLKIASAERETGDPAGR